MKMESITLRRLTLLLLVWYFLLLSGLPQGEARRYRRSSYGSNTRSSANAPRMPGFTHYFLIVIIVLGCILVFVCCFLNGLRCLQNLLFKRNKKPRVRRRPSSGTRRHGRAGYQGDTIDQSELGPPPSYAEIVEYSTAPPPAYSSLHVGDGGWAAQPPASCNTDSGSTEKRST